MKSEVIVSDCLEAMRSMEADSVDAIVTDPPYGLAFCGAKWDSFGGRVFGRDSIETRQEKAAAYAEENSGAPRYGNSHSSSPTVGEMRSFQSAMTPIFAEALRVAKPGAYLLAFGGTRTYHRLACAIEDAGWEVRDCIAWCYSTGFNHGMDVAKAIAKEEGSSSERRASARAEEWHGWNTGLKPAWESIVVARTPLDGTVAHNVLKYGTGAINIDGCRVPTEENISTYGKRDSAKIYGKYNGMTPQQSEGQKLGRFPANLIHDGSDEVLALFPESKGQCGAVKGTEPSRTGSNGIYGQFAERYAVAPRGDSGSAARFFYCAKASTAERQLGCEGIPGGNRHTTVKPVSLMRWLVRLVCRKGGLVLDPFCGSGTTGVACALEDMDFIGCEREEGYAEIARARIAAAEASPSAYDEPRKGARGKTPVVVQKPSSPSPSASSVSQLLLPI